MTEVGNYAFCTSNNEYTSLQLPASDVTVTVTFCLRAYNIDIAQNIQNGTVSASVNNEPATTAKMGDLVTLTCTPDEGYVLVENSIQVLDGSYNYLPVYNNQFLMPASNVTVAAAFLPAAKPVSYIDEAGEERTAMAYDPTHQNKGGFDRPGIVQGPNKYT